MMLIHYLDSADKVADLAAPQNTLCYEKVSGTTQSVRHFIHRNFKCGHCDDPAGYSYAALAYGDQHKGAYSKARATLLMLATAVSEDPDANKHMEFMSEKFRAESVQCGDELAAVGSLGGGEFWRARMQESGSRGFIGSDERKEALKLAKRIINDIRYNPWHDRVFE